MISEKRRIILFRMNKIVDIPSRVMASLAYLGVQARSAACAGAKGEESWPNSKFT
jgi:hypothetical protein